MLRLVVQSVLVCLFTTFSAGVLSEEIDSINVAGLTQPVEIVRDKWGVSHIYASNQHDLFFAQGFNAARDRLFQFEMWRRRATGTLAEIQGSKAFAHDRGARLLRYRGNIEKEMAHYHDDGVEIITAFVAGVNSYIDLTRDDPDLLPFEFALLGIKPGHWAPGVVLSRHNALTGGIATELMLSKTITAIGPDLTAKILPFERHPYLDPLPGIVLAEITDEVMQDYIASRGPPAFDQQDVVGDTSLQKSVSINQYNEVADYMLNPTDVSLGSNNWVISGSRTRSGKPLMANDPHRSIQNPSLRYMVHLNAPGWNVIGAGEPVLPGVSIGHNEYGAWGLTVFRIDQEDLYVYTTNPDKPGQYWYEGEWQDMETETQTISVRGENDRSVTLKYTVHGPVVYESNENHTAYAMRAVWLEPGAAPYLASLRMDQARTWDEFRQACTYSGLPGENMVWADRKGNIGWQSVGFTPVRFGWDGRLPVPGNGDYEWQGFVPIRYMPHLSNPEAGFYGTANQNNVPEGYPNIFSDFYSDPVRAARLNEVLSGTKDHTIQDSIDLQYDTRSKTAEKIVPFIVQLDVPGKLEAALSELKNWDYRFARESRAAAIYDQWEAAMLRQVNVKFFPAVTESGRAAIGRPKLAEWLMDPPEYVFGPNPRSARDHMMQDNLALVLGRLSKEYGEKMSAWTYGKIHYTQIDHPLGHLVGPELRERINLGPLPRGGTGNTLNANHGADRQTAGASFRMIVDTADWDSTVSTNTPGQSGDPRSPFYSNLFKGWNEADYFPVYFSRDKVETVVHDVTKLVPR
jgi:penicillin G amidase